VYEVYAGQPEIIENVRRCLAGEEFSAEVRAGDQLLFDTRYSPSRDASGNVVGLTGVSVDITERRRAQEARRMAEERLRAVAANAPVVLAAIDGNGVFTLSEGAGLGSLGLRPGEVVGRSIYELYAGMPDVIEHVQRCLAGEEFSSEVRIGDIVYDNRYAPLRDEEGRVVGAIGVSVDITERRRAEQALLQAQKLESLGVLAGGIAHDFNNLLVGILGNAGLALMEISPQSPARETLREIEIAGQRAAELSRQMLAYSGKGNFVIDQVDLSELVDEMTHLLQVSIGKDVRLTCNFARGLPPVEADATQIRQVIMNLVVNASDAIGDKAGAIMVSTGLMQADSAYLTEPYLAPELAAGEYVYVEVTDTGSGMDSETQTRIFDPFFTTKFTGRGLGLAAVLGIVRGHRGAIKVESKPGKGSTFRLLLPPSAVAVVPAASAAAPAAAWRGSGTVLVVDDEEAVRAVTARAISSFGFGVLTAVDGLTGVETFREHAGEIVCVLLDMTMPGLNGEEAFRQMRSISPAAKVIIMSGFNQQEASERFAGQGLSGFVQKPYRLETLREEIRRVVEG
jgi:PAS domain S-box-containing protein